MTSVSVGPVASSTPLPLPHADHASGSTRVFRLPQHPMVVLKQPLGRSAAERLRHEKDVLERLVLVDGVARVVPSVEVPGALALEDGGATLASLLGRGRMELQPLLDLACQLVSTLAKMHACGVVHQDITPSNIVCAPTGRCTLIDFDSACGDGLRAATGVEQDRRGTLAYMAPEQTGRTGRPTDHRADLYSFGVVLYEMVLGRLPFDSSDALALMHAQLVQMPTAPVQVDPAVPQPLSDIILRLLQKEPGRRYHGAEGLAHDLQRVRDAVQRGEECSFAIAEQDFGARLPAPLRAVGRDAELTALRALLCLSENCMEPCILLAGPAGAGKTMLVRELKGLVADHQDWFVSATFHQHRRDAFASGAALRALGRLLLAEPEEKLAVYRERILKAVGRNLGVGPTQLPEFELLLGKHPAPAMTDSRDAQARINQTSIDLLRSVASAGRRIVMVLEDLQWAPSITLAFLDAVVSSPEASRGLIVVGTFRPSDLDDQHPLHVVMERWRKTRNVPAQLEVTNLQPAALSQMVAEMLHASPGDVRGLATALYDRTGGNPHDTVELVNALRQKGLLHRSEGRWHWDAPQIRAYVGECSVPLLLARRVEKLGPDTRRLLQAIACLGGGVRPAALEAAVGMDGAALRELLIPAVDDGLILVEDGASPLVRFRHARVQQTVLDAMGAEQRVQLHLDMARRLLASPGYERAAAEQYLPAAAAVEAEDERLRVTTLLGDAARTGGVLNLGVSERYLDAAISLLPQGSPGSSNHLRELQTARHHVLYAMGRFAEGDIVYASLSASTADPIVMTPIAAVQMYSLANRAQYKQALSIGLDLLAALGRGRPPNYREALHTGLARVTAWCRSDEKLADFDKPVVTEPSVLAAAVLLARTLTAAYFCDAATVAWAAREAHTLWTTHGPCEPLLHGASAAASLLVGLPQDHRGAYAGMRHLIAVGEAKGMPTGAAYARFAFCMSIAHWIDPIEDVAAGFRAAREELMRSGDHRMASYTYLAADVLLDCQPVLDEALADVETGLAMAVSNGGADYAQRYLPRRQLLRALRGDTRAPGSFDDDSFIESAYVQQLAGADISAATYHIVRTIGAAIFGDAQAWSRHAEAARPLLARIPGYYLVAVLRTLHGVALAEAARTAEGAERAAALAELETSELPWLRQRADEAPANYLHLVRWLEAEHAWSCGSVWDGGAAFDRAVAQAVLHQRPWHAALITERAAQFHLAHGLESSGRALLAQARNRYGEWGAHGKVRELERNHPVLRARTPAERSPRHNLGSSAAASSDAMDLMAVIRASQSLSSETDLEQLRARVTEVLEAMTGATHVRLAIWQEDAGGWMVPAGGADGIEHLIPLEEAGTRGLVPTTALRYAERTSEALLVGDACKDERFSADPYFASLECCSLLVVPILRQGSHQAMLLLENRLGAGAFSADRLDSVTLIAGQLAVSLENALLYRDLEQRVQERTRQLRVAQAELVDTARRAGMAEIANNVLHNVGNVLNSVNVSGSLVAVKLRTSRVNGLARAVEMIRSHEHDLAEFLMHDEKGRLLPAYLSSLSEAVAAEHKEMGAEMQHLMRSVDHIKAVVATQQSHAGRSCVVEPIDVQTVVEDALRMNAIPLERHGIRVERDFEPVPLAQLDKNRVLQILVNLIRNGVEALGATDGERWLKLRIALTNSTIGIRVTDTGAGIAAENLTSIFAHGFTTRESGHGFGLHSSALAAKEMGGTLIASSDGVGRGATFSLDLPMEHAEFD